jgi:hypothetical protein
MAHMLNIQTALGRSDLRVLLRSRRIDNRSRALRLIAAPVSAAEFQPGTVPGSAESLTNCLFGREIHKSPRSG